MRGKKDLSDKLSYNENGIYKLLFDFAGEGLVVADQKGIIRLTNPRLEKLFGYKRNELIGQAVDILIPSAVRRNHKHHRDKYAKAPKQRPMGKGIDLAGVKKDGTEFPVEISLNHINKGTEMLIVGLVTDISERKKANELLKKEKETAQKYLDIAGVMFVVINQNQKVDLINRKGCEILGYKESGIVGKNWFDSFIPKDQREQVRKVFSKILSGKASNLESFENPILIKGGKLRWVLWHNTLIKDLNGNITGTLSSGEDVTEWKEAEMKLQQLNLDLEKRVENRTVALKESQDLYNAIARNFPNGTINVFDRDLRYVFVDGKELHESGMMNQMFIGTRISDHLTKDQANYFETQLKEVFKGKNLTFELEIENRYFVFYGVPLKDSKRRINQVLVVANNITKQKKAEERILKALEKEKELNELKSRFVSMASHEFRTPLSTILSSVSLIKRYGELENEEKRDKHIKRIKSSVNNLTNILNDFLSLDKLEEGKVQSTSVKIDVKEFCDEVIEEMQAVAKEGQKIIYKHSGKENLYLDINLLKNILINLLSNAIKYSSENKKINLKTEFDKTGLVITVKDQGIGIPDEDKDHMFERFFRAQNSMSIQGTGLGLNIVKKYLDLLGGSIKFTSKQDVGTTFIATIPQSKRP